MWSSNWLRGLMAMALLTFATGSPTDPTTAVAADTSFAPSPGRAASAESDNQPSAIDLRPIFDRWGLETRRQGGRGTCSAFAVTDAIEFALASRERQATRLSVEFLNWASNQTTRTPEDGGFFSDLWNGCAKYGICPEEDMPYLDHFDPTVQPSEQALAHAKKVLELGLQLHWIKEWDPKRGLNDDQFAGVKRTLRQRWPVCGGFLWPKQQRWENGVLQMCPREAVRDGHSVVLAGYRDDPAMPGGGVFLIRNTAGHSRDGMMTYEYVRTYMNDAVWIDFGDAEGRQERAGKTLSPLRGLDVSTAGIQGLTPLATSCRPYGTEEAVEESGRPAVGGCGEVGRPAPSASASLFGDPLGALAAPPNGRNRRISSHEQPAWNDANLDMNWLQPGQVLELPMLQGPGAITHMWFTSHAGWANELNALSLRIYWDGRTEPGVEAPLGDFFAVGQGKPAVVESWPVQVSPTGALTCYWRMPFAKSARIVIANDNPDRGAGLYWQVDWVQLDELPPDTAYFHAQYRQEYPAVLGRDYLIADLSGRGQYVGTVMSVTLAQDGWFGEGDDFFYIDGEQVPSLQGTGSEDYFNDAWGFRPRTGPWFGQPRWQGDRTGDSGVCYRWHVLDPVGFTDSLRLAIEHKGNYEDDLEGFYVERPDFFSSVAFWYQTGQPKRFGKLPPWHQRRVPWRQQHLVRAFREAQTTGSAKVKVQAQGFFGSRPLLAWPNKERDAELSLPFTVDEDGRYAVRLTAMQGPEAGRYGIWIDDKELCDRDFRAPEIGELDLLVGTRELTKGTHRLTFRVVDTPGPLAVEMLRLLKLPPPAIREVKTRNEAHFVRLGIGRSLYAYRLAYGQLPDSLDALVQAGIMPARYLNDENDVPLKARREGEYMVVESTAPGGWQHRWQGLDPRR